MSPKAARTPAELDRWRAYSPETKGLGARSLPPPLLTSEVGSFARQTVTARQPQILQLLIRENGYPQDIVESLESLHDEISHLPMRPLLESAPDRDSWNELIGSRVGRTWLDSSWYLAEAFFYRRLLEAVRYFQVGPWRRVDPFATQKRALEARAVDGFRAVPDEIAGTDEALAFESLLHSSLWGNRADLSNASMPVVPKSGLATRRERPNIIVDGTDQAFDTLSGGLSRVDFVADNAGMDVLADLALVDFLLAKGWVGSVVIHLKDRPFFVSDAMPSDVEALVDRLLRSTHMEPRGLAVRLAVHSAAGQLKIACDPFWASGLMFRNMSQNLAAHLSRSDLVILKGDVNYRRLLDDRKWPFTTPISVCGDYFPAPFLALRTLKGEIMAGLAPGDAESLQRADPDWLVNGRRGVVQMGARAQTTPEP